MQSNNSEKDYLKRSYVIAGKTETTYKYLTPENIEKAKEELKLGKSMGEIRKTTGLSAYYLRKIKAGEDVPTNGRPKKRETKD